MTKQLFLRLQIWFASTFSGLLGHQVEMTKQLFLAGVLSKLIISLLLDKFHRSARMTKLLVHHDSAENWDSLIWIWFLTWADFGPWCLNLDTWDRRCYTTLYTGGPALGCVAQQCLHNKADTTMYKDACALYNDVQWGLHNSFCTRMCCACNVQYIIVQCTMILVKCAMYKDACTMYNDVQDTCTRVFCTMYNDTCATAANLKPVCLPASQT